GEIYPRHSGEDDENAAVESTTTLRQQLAYDDTSSDGREGDVTGGDNYIHSVRAHPQRIHVRRPRRAPMLQRTEHLYGTFRTDAEAAGITDDHPIVASVEQLYGLARELIDV